MQEFKQMELKPKKVHIEKELLYETKNMVLRFQCLKHQMGVN